MSWISDDELSDLRTRERQLTLDNARLRDDLKVVGTFTLAAIKLLRNPTATGRYKLFEDTLFVILQRCTGYKKTFAELLLDIKPKDQDYAPPSLPKSRDE